LRILTLLGSDKAFMTLMNPFIKPPQYILESQYSESTHRLSMVST
jgi:hypothetical protein